MTDEQLKILAEHLRGLERYQGSEPDGLAPTHELLTLLCAVPRVENPDSAPQVAKPMDALSLMACIAPAHFAAIPGSYITEINRFIAAGDRAGTIRWAHALHYAALISTTERNALLAELTATVADPDHPAEVDGGPAPIQELLGYEVGVSRLDVNTALGRGEDL